MTFGNDSFTLAAHLWEFIDMNNYYTVFAFDPSCGSWFDVFGSYDRSECKEEADALFWDDFELKAGQIVIKKHAGTIESLRAILTTLNNK